MILHVRDRRTAKPRSNVVPAEAAPRRMVARVVSITREVRHVDAADESNSAVDDHRLLMMTMERMITGICLAANAGTPGERLDGLADFPARRMKYRHRSPRPNKHPYLESLGRFRQE